MSAIVKLYVYNNFHIALCALAFTAEYYLRNNQPLDKKYLVFIFFSTLALYCLHRIIGINKIDISLLDKRMLSYKRMSKILFSILIISGLCASISFLSLPQQVMLMCIAPIFISLFYALPIFGKQMRLRDFPFIKIFLIAIVWTWLCYYIPASQHNDIDKFYLLECVFFMLLITLPFDIRDLRVDSSSGTKTIPGTIGIKSTKILGTFLFVIALVIIYFQREVSTVKIALTLCYLLAWILLLGTNKERSDLYYSFFIDGLLIVRYLIILFLI